MINWLDTNTPFPPIEQALNDPNGLLAAGADLSPERLISAYHQGIFPWYSEDEPVLWWSPAPRCILEPKDIHISKSMRKLLNKKPYSITIDQAFEEVIQHCADTRKEGTWINMDIQDAYCQLHQLNIAHSIEVWQDELLVGGLYGISLGRVFFGESMFSLVNNSSKVAIIHLCHHLQQAGFSTIDCQQATAHLKSLGAKDITREEFKRRLIDTYTPPNTNPWQHKTIILSKGAS